MIDYIAVYLFGLLSGIALYQPWYGQRRLAARGREAGRGMVLRAFDVGGPAREVTTSPATYMTTSAPPTRAEEWRLAVTVFAFHGNMTGFSYRAMSAAGVCRRAAWETYGGLMLAAGVLVRQSRIQTAWAPAWGYPRFRVELRRGVLALPYPIDTPPPPLSVGVATQTAQHSTGGTERA